MVQYINIRQETSEEGNGIVPPTVKNYVKQEDRILEETIVQKQGLFLEFIRQQYQNLVINLNTIPNMIIRSTIESSTSVSNKLYEYADALGGKNGDKDNDVETLMITKSHLDYLDKFRRKNESAYKNALIFYDKLLDQNMARKDQCTAIAAYVEKNFKTFEVS